MLIFESAALHPLKQEAWQFTSVIESIVGKAALPSVLALFDSSLFYIKATLLLGLIIGIVFIAGSLILDG